MFKTAIKGTIEQLNSRFADLYFNNSILIATYLDPCYKMKFFNEVNIKHVESELISLLDSTDNTVNHAEGKDVEAPAKKRANLSSPSANVLKTNVKSILSNVFIMSSGDEDVNTTTNTQLFDKLIAWKLLLNEYNKEKRILISEDPLLWWRENKKFKNIVFDCSPVFVVSARLSSK